MRQRRLVELLLAGTTLTEAAQRLGVGRKTVYRWLQRPAVQQALRELEQERWSELSRKLQHCASEAIDTLVDLMRHAVTPSTRLRAATTLLELSIKVEQLVDLEQRIEALEQKLGR